LVRDVSENYTLETAQVSQKISDMDQVSKFRSLNQSRRSICKLKKNWA